MSLTNLRRPFRIRTLAAVVGPLLGMAVGLLVSASSARAVGVWSIGNFSSAPLEITASSDITRVGNKNGPAPPLDAVRNMPAGEYESGYSEFTVGGGFAHS